MHNNNSIVLLVLDFKSQKLVASLEFQRQKSEQKLAREKFGISEMTRSENQRYNALSLRCRIFISLNPTSLQLFLLACAFPRNKQRRMCAL